MSQGPNVKRLIAHKASVDCVPKGGGIQAALLAITTPGRLAEALRRATEWVTAAIAAVKSAPGGDQYGDDEAIAGEILKQIEARSKVKRAGH